MTSVATLDRWIRDHHLLKHPFYVAWAKGEVPLAVLRAYAGQYYHFESNFPRYVGATYSHIPDGASRRFLLENLVDEEGRDPTHPELWVDFGRGLGMTPKAVRSAPPSPATRALCATYERLTLEGTVASGLGALYAYESIFPEIAAEKSRGLREQYGIGTPSAHEFFRVHTFADKAHSAAERKLLRKEIARSASRAREADRATRAAVQAWWKFLDTFAGQGEGNPL
ncbi:MAG: CADD family putative folate metabolism protein [Thermoplasmata archaeon]|nr:CADD family putative folate metabolism protein [Thermoplasmata archaeon]